MPLVLGCKIHKLGAFWLCQPISTSQFLMSQYFLNLLPGLTETGNSMKRHIFDQLTDVLLSVTGWEKSWVWKLKSQKSLKFHVISLPSPRAVWPCSDPQTLAGQDVQPIQCSQLLYILLFPLLIQDVTDSSCPSLTHVDLILPLASLVFL